MSEHHAEIVWKRETPDFAYKTYNRDHTWTFKNGEKVRASAATSYFGNPQCVDPEEAFVASLASCHMLTFLALAAFKGIGVDHYEDKAVGFLEKNEQGKLAITKVQLNPKILFTKENPSQEILKALHDKAHHECFIASSVKTEIQVVF